MSEYMDYIADVNDVQDSVNDLALKMYEQGRADAIDDALKYCNQNNDEKEECWSCCLSIWKDGKFEGCYLEQLKEQNNG